MPPIDAAWNIGVWCKNTSSAVNRHICITWYRLSISARWSSNTPFGSPVVPPVYMRIAGSSSSGSSGIARRRAAASRSSYVDVVRRVAATDHHDVLDADRGAHLVDDRREELVGEAHLRAGVGEDVLELLGREPQVQRVDHARAEERGVVALEELVTVERHDREPVAGGRHRGRGDPPTGAPTRSRCSREGRVVVAVEEPDTIGVALHRREQQAVIHELFHVPIPLARARRRRTLDASSAPRAE